MLKEYTFIQPDDWHLHLRDHHIMRAVLPFSARVFRRAIVMPNLSPPIYSAKDALAYRNRIINALPTDVNFIPLMTAYLADHTDPDDLILGFQKKIFTAAKLYPAGATTNSEYGVTEISRIKAILSAMQEARMPLLVHGEVNSPEIDIFDREKVFIETVMKPLLYEFPDLRVVLEHITTEEAVGFVNSAGSNIAATITPHHLVMNRNTLFAGGIRPHYYCLPIVKREHHRLALRAAATSGDASFFLGTDSAPHFSSDKESSCGCAGIFNAPSAIEIYAEVFEEEGKLDQLENFSSLNGPNFYELPPNEDTITLVRGEQRAKPEIEVGSEKIVSFAYGQNPGWTLLAAK